MRKAVIEDPVINSVFARLQRHFRFDDEELNNEVVPGHCASSYMPISKAKKKSKAGKIATTRKFWIPAVKNCRGFGRWAFIEISDPWDAEITIRGFLQASAEFDKVAA